MHFCDKLFAGTFSAMKQRILTMPVDNRCNTIRPPTVHLREWPVADENRSSRGEAGSKKRIWSIFTDGAASALPFDRQSMAIDQQKLDAGRYRRH